MKDVTMTDVIDVTPQEDEAMNKIANDRQVGGTHYTDMPVQPWTVMESLLTHEEFVGVLKGNIIKYAMRVGRKTEGDADKLKHYQQKLAEVIAARSAYREL